MLHVCAPSQRAYMPTSNHYIVAICSMNGGFILCCQQLHASSYTRNTIKAPVMPQLPPCQQCMMIAAILQRATSHAALQPSTHQKISRQDSQLQLIYPLRPPPHPCLASVLSVSLTYWNEKVIREKGVTSDQCHHYLALLHSVHARTDLSPSCIR